MTEAAHAFLAPSSAARWVVCPGSALMESKYPEQGDKEAAEEGTATHWVASQLLEGWAPEVLMQDGRALNGVPLTWEMIEAAQLFADDVRSTLAPFAAVPSVEQRVSIPRVHPTLNWGTPDVRAWASYLGAAERFLYLWDFKYGHKHVDVFENWQLMDYAAGCLSEANEHAQAAGLAAWPEERITVVFRIVQPRSYHRDGPIREWRIKAPDLRPYVHRLAMAAEAATGALPECVPQADACENCNARHACEALQRAAYRGMDLARQAQALELTPAALGLELRYLRNARKLMDARESGLAAQAEAIIRGGGAVPHWKMAAGGSRMKWTKSDAEIIALGDMMGVPLAKPAQPVTPTQAKAAGLNPELVSAYAVNPPGAMKLEVDDGADARRTFV